MSATTQHHTHHHSEGNYSILTIDRIGLWLFLLSESMLFLGLLSARFYLAGTFRPPELNQALGIGITSILLVSSLTMFRSEVAIRHGDQTSFLRHLLITIGLSILFLGGVAYEWSQAFAHFPPNTVFGTIFFSMTGMHALHVLSGIFLMLLIYRNGRTGKYSEHNHWSVEATAKYWHMVDVVWVFFYAALYLV